MAVNRQTKPPLLDMIVAAGLLTGALLEVWVTRTAIGPEGAGTAVAIVSAVPVAWRRSLPIATALGAAVAILLPVVWSPRAEADGLVDFLAWLVAVHALNAYGSSRTAVLGTGAVAGSMVVAILSLAPVREQPGDLVWAVSMLCAAAAAGQIMRCFAAAQAAERAAAEAAARAAERRRLARELHDVVSHAVAAMVVQAGAAQRLIVTDPERAWALLESVQRAGETSASELRRLLGLLDRDNLARQPQPRLTDLAALVRNVEAAGVPAALEVSTGSVDITPGIQMTAYRVVQEALTNAVKHGPHSSVSVVVRIEGVHLVVTVLDTDAIVRASDRPGHGLRGLRERVEIYAGTFDAGPSDSGFRVEARIPLESSGVPTSVDTETAR